MVFNRLKKGQVSIELIIILAVLIIGAILVGVVLINSSNKNIESAANTSNSTSEVTQNFINDVESQLGNDDPNLEPIPGQLSVSITYPSSSKDYNIAANDSISFSATVSNYSGSYDCNWYVGSNLLYELQNTCDGEDILLPDDNFPNADNYVISVSVKDSDENTANDTVTISVVDNELTPDPLNVNITNPSNSTNSWTTGLTYSLNAEVNGNSGDYTCDWNIDNLNILSKTNSCNGSYTTLCSDIGTNKNLIVNINNNGSEESDSVILNILSLSSSITSPINNSNYYVGETIDLSSSNSRIYGNNISNLDCNWYLGNNLISSNCQDSYILQEQDVGNNLDLNLVITDTCTTFNKNLEISVIPVGDFVVNINEPTTNFSIPGDSINLNATYDNNVGVVDCNWYLDNTLIASGCNTNYNVSCSDVSGFSYDLNVVAKDSLNNFDFDSKTHSVIGFLGYISSPSQDEFYVGDEVSLIGSYFYNNSDVTCRWYLDSDLIKTGCNTTYVFENADVGQKELSVTMEDGCGIHNISSKTINVINNSSYTFIASVNQPSENSTYDPNQTINFSTDYSGNIGPVSCVYKIRDSSNNLISTYNTCSGTTTLSSSGIYTFNLTATDISACSTNPSTCEFTDVSSVTIIDSNVPDLTAEIILPAHTINAIYGSISMYEYQDFESSYDSTNYQNPQCIWYRKESINGTPVSFLNTCNFSGIENNTNMKDLGFIIDSGISKTYYIFLEVTATPIAGGSNQTYQTPNYMWNVTKPSFTLQNPVNPYDFANGGGTLYTRSSPINFPEISGYPPNFVKFTYFINPEGNGLCQEGSNLVFGNGIYSTAGNYSRTFTSTELIPFIEACNQQSNTFSCNYCLRVETLDGYAIMDFENRVITNYNSDDK